MENAAAEPSEPVPAACGWGSCDPPLRGGVRIGEFGCSAGFKAVGVLNSNRYVLSAGHCAENPFVPEFVAYNSNLVAPHWLGVTEAAYWGTGGHDLVKIRANGSPTWDTNPWPVWVVVTSDDIWTQTENRTITSEAKSFIGEYACHTGITTGTSCGTVNQMNLTVDYFDQGRHVIVKNLTELAGICIAGGDSGGPVFAGGTALGITSFGNGEATQCGKGQYDWYSEITEDTAYLGVSVAPLEPPPAGSPAKPTVETKAATNIQEGQATLNGTVNPNGSETTYRFEYGKTANYGSSIPVPDAGAGAGTSATTVYLTPNTLLPRTRYHFRLVATNAGGTTYGSDQAFTTGVKWSVRNSNSSGSPQVAFWFGLPGETRVSGDWDGNGTSTPGVYKASTGVWKLSNSNATTTPFTTFQYGGGPWTTPVVGDWNGDGKDTVGVYDPSAGNWNLRDSNGEGPPTYSFQYGGGPWTKPVVGDWNGDGKDTVGVYDPSAGNWNLRDTLASGPSTYSFQYGGGPWSGAVAGDWNGDGKDSIGVYDPSAGNWNLKNANQFGNADYSFQYGGSQYQFTVGDWDGNKTDTPALSEANAPTAIEYQLRNKNEPGNPEIGFESGSPEQTPLAGDWNGDKVTTTGRYEPITGKWFLRTTNSAGIFSPIEFQYGGSGFKPVVGDWDGNKSETAGLYEPIEGRWELRNENSAGPPQLDFKYGGSQFKPVVGDWDGDGKDTAGLYEPIEGRWELRNENSAGPPQLDFKYGGSQFKPVVGDWDGNGTDTVGLVTW
jgi:hypothetical protein